MYILLSGEGNGNPLQYSCLENPMDRGAWQATVPGVTRVRHDLVTKLPPPPYTSLDFVGSLPLLLFLLHLSSSFFTFLFLLLMIISLSSKQCLKLVTHLFNTGVSHSEPRVWEIHWESWDVRPKLVWGWIVTVLILNISWSLRGS